jgi:methyl-accepting chemotaxis protein
MKRKITSVLFIIFFCFVLGISIAVMSIKDINSELNHIIKLHKVEQLRRTLLINVQSVQTHLHTINTEFSKNLDIIVNNGLQLTGTAKECSSCHHPPQLNSRIIHVQSLIKDYQEYLSFYITARADTEKMLHHKTTASELGEKILFEVENMSHGATQRLEELTRKSNENIRHVRTILAVTILSTLLLSIVLAIILTRSVTRPIQRLLDATKLITSGQLGTSVSYSDKAELGELAKNFNEMSANLKERNIRLLRRDEELEAKSEELKKRVKELEEFYNMSIGRELKMKEMKDTIGKLEAELSRLKK